MTDDTEARLTRIEGKLDTLLERFPTPRPRTGGFAQVETEEQEHDREAREHHR